MRFFSADERKPRHEISSRIAGNPSFRAFEEHATGLVTIRVQWELQAVRLSVFSSFSSSVSQLVAGVMDLSLKE